MGLGSWISATIGSWMGKPAGSAAPTQANHSRSQRSPVTARFDIAQTTRENLRHWYWADGLSALSAGNPSVRKTIRNRSRYELANNSNYQGMIRTLASDTIGTGPRPALRIPGVSADDIKTVEREFTKWMKATRFVSKLRTMKMSKDVDGGGIGVFVDNPKIRHPVTLDLRIFEDEQMATPTLMIASTREADGITFDEFGNPETYHFLKTHPGDPMGNFSLETEQVDARYVIHWFRAERPGQVRGIPWFMSSLPMFANLRRFTLATISAAETAASHSGVIQSTLAPSEDDDEECVTPEAGDTFQIDHDLFTTLPQGWTMNQLKPEQPTTSYAAFKSECLADISRPASMPKNIATCDSSSYNYSSSRLDHQLYYKQIGIEQDDCETVVLDPVFEHWLVQALLIEGYLPFSIRQAYLTGVCIVIEWNWDEPVSIDPVKDVTANALALASGQATYQGVWGRKGVDYIDAYDQLEIEKGQREKRGLTFSFNTSSPPPPEDDTEPQPQPPLNQPTNGRFSLS